MEDQSTNAVIDLSHHNGAELDFTAAAHEGILGVVHEATQGTGDVDPTYVEHRSPALGAGLYWRAYHFGVGADGVEQADFFLTTVKPDPSNLLVLDFEANTERRRSCRGIGRAGRSGNTRMAPSGPSPTPSRVSAAATATSSTATAPP